MPSDDEPLEIDLNTTGTAEGIIAILASTSATIRLCKGRIRLIMKIIERV